MTVVNRGDCNTHGVEISAAWKPLQWLKTYLSYSYLDSDIDQSGMAKNLLSWRTHFDFLKDVDIDFWLRYVDDVKASRAGMSGLVLYDIDAYLTLDLRLAWQIHDQLEFIAVGQNLLNNGHVEYIQETFIAPTETPRSFYCQFKWSF